jgi:hypothetical protein
MLKEVGQRLLLLPTLHAERSGKNIVNKILGWNGIPSNDPAFIDSIFLLCRMLCRMQTRMLAAQLEG